MCLEEQFRNHMLLFSETEIQTKTEDLRKSLQKESSLVEEFFERYRVHYENSDDINAIDTRILESYRNFRLELNKQELKSDVLYATIKNCCVNRDGEESDISMY